MRALYLGACGSLITLTALCVAWELFAAPLRPGGSWLVLKVLPLLLPLRGVLLGRRYTYQWSVLLVPAYFAEGIVRAMTESAASQFFAIAEIALTIAFFSCAIFYVRVSLKRENGGLRSPQCKRTSLQ